MAKKASVNIYKVSDICTLLVLGNNIVLVKIIIVDHKDLVSTWIYGINWVDEGVPFRVVVFLVSQIYFRAIILAIKAILDDIKNDKRVVIQIFREVYIKDTDRIERTDNRNPVDILGDMDPKIFSVNFRKTINRTFNKDLLDRTTSKVYIGIRFHAVIFIFPITPAITVIV